MFGQNLMGLGFIQVSDTLICDHFKQRHDFGTTQMENIVVEKVEV